MIIILILVLVLVLVVLVVLVIVVVIVVIVVVVIISIIPPRRLPSLRASQSTQANKANLFFCYWLGWVKARIVVLDFGPIIATDSPNRSSFGLPLSIFGSNIDPYLLIRLKHRDWMILDVGVPICSNDPLVPESAKIIQNWPSPK